MGSIYEGVIAILDKFGFFNIILPWVLVYALVYGILLRLKLFGEPFDKNNPAQAKFARNVSSLIAFSIASIVIGTYHATVTIRDIIPLVAVFIIIIFSLVTVLAAFFLPTGQIQNYNKYMKFLAFPALLIFILILLNYFGFLSVGEGSGPSLFEEYKDYIAAVGFLAVFAVIAWLLTREKAESKQQEQQK